eukprot:2098461-Rhodomonas_salina.1
MKCNCGAPACRKRIGGERDEASGDSGVSSEPEKEEEGLWTALRPKKAQRPQCVQETASRSQHDEHGIRLRDAGWMRQQMPATSSQFEAMSAWMEGAEGFGDQAEVRKTVADSLQTRLKTDRALRKRM